jgi:hypothetical protein
MYNFLVLGMIPDTNIVITFQAWLNLLGLIFVAYLIRRFFQRRTFTEFAPVRVPLHANQLHRHWA